jgi:hypothetical protein
MRDFIEAEGMMTMHVHVAENWYLMVNLTSSSTSVEAMLK